MTFKERLIAGLLAAGFQQDKSDRSKYMAFTRVVDGKLGKMFVGPNGALRVGRNASNSHSIGDPSHQTPLYKRYLELGGLHRLEQPAKKGNMIISIGIPQEHIKCFFCQCDLTGRLNLASTNGVVVFTCKEHVSSGSAFVNTLYEALRSEQN